jgi:hypothetical protein
LNGEEVWRLVPSRPGVLASSWGRVLRRPFQQKMPHGGLRWYRSQPTYGVRVPTTGLAGFRMIVHYSGVGRNMKVHRLVCEAFHGPPPFEAAIVMHIDDDPANNRPENLKWATQKENLNAPQFIAYCESRTGDKNPFRRSRAAR